MLDPMIEETIRARIDGGDLSGAATTALRAYGPQVLGYLRAVLRDEEVAKDAFSQFCEFVWQGMATFRGESSFLTWAYRLAWGAVRRHGEDPYRRRKARLDTHEAAELAEHVYSSTATERGELRGLARELRDELSSEDQTLLILRLDRELSWREIAQIFAQDGVALEEAALRKRFERLKKRFRDALLAKALPNKRPP